MIKQRNSNIELLRIISIIMITISHYSVHGVINDTFTGISLNKFLFEIMTLGNIGVIIFVIITGYYGVNQNKPFKLNKFVRILSQVLFYSLIIYLILMIMGIEPFSIKELLKSLLPITFKKYWFISGYIILYIFMPYINKFINSLSKKEFAKFILIDIAIFSILHMITSQDYYGNELIQMLLFYSIGAYLGKYKIYMLKSKKVNKIVLLITSMLMILSVIIFDLIGTKYHIFSEHSTYLMNRTSILSIVFAVSLFNLFINKKSFSNKLINSISACVLGVYLISDNPMIRKILWTDIFQVYKYVNSNLLLIHMIVCITIIFIICICIDYLRIISIQKLIDMWFNKFEMMIKKSKIYNKTYLFFNKIENGE